MYYGIISQVDDATTRAFFKNKRVPDANVVYITQMASLLKMLKSGDVVFVVSVNRFTTVSQFFQFGKFCISNGVSLHLLAQPYLDLGNGKHWKSSVISQMMRMVAVFIGFGVNVQGGSFALLLPCGYGLVVSDWLALTSALDALRLLLRSLVRTKF